VLVGGENGFLGKWFSNFSLFGTIKDGKLFSKENDFPCNGGKWFPLWEDGIW